MGFAQMVFHIGLDEIESTELVVAVTAHLPVGAHMGKIRAVSTAGILSDLGMFGLDDNGGAWRMITMGGGLCEVTRWRNGVETGRQIIRPDQ